MRVRSFYILIFSSLLFAACEPDPDPVETIMPAKLQLSIDARWDGGQFVMQDVYNDNFGNRLRVDNFMTYLSMIRLVKQDGSEVLLKDFYLHNFVNDTTFVIDVEPGVYTGLRFGLGIPSEYNMHEDPAQYPNAHPLSVQGSQGMFWHWNTGYIFTKFEGKADTTGTEGAELLHSFSFHIGDDPFYTEYESLSENLNLQSNTATGVSINVHMDELLGTGGDPDGIDLATDAITHTGGNTELAQRFVNNFTASITID